MKTIWITAITCICIYPVLDSGAQTTEVIQVGQGYAATIEETFTVEPGGELTIDADFGSVRIETSTSNTVEVLVEKRLKEGTEDQARRAFEEVEVTTEQRGNDVRIGVDKSRWFKRNRVSIAMTVQVPDAYNLDIKTAGGGIDIGDLNGEITAKTAGGSIRTGTTNGDVTARTLGGSIRIGPTDGGVSAKTLGGSIAIGDTNGDVSAHTLGGSIRVGIADGDVFARTMGGNITVEDASGKVSAKTLGGKVRVGST